MRASGGSVTNLGASSLLRSFGELVSKANFASSPPPRIVFVGSVVAATISGAVGFGGALLLLPLLTRIVGPELGVPLLTLAEVVGNATRAALGIRSVAWWSAPHFLCAAVPSAVLGSYCFVALPKTLVTRLIGAAILVFVLLRWRGLLTFRMTPLRLAASGFLVGFLSGLVGSAGPLAAAAFLSLDLSPLAYVATEAVTAVVMHAAKSLVYRRFVQLDANAWVLAALLSAGMILGSWIGRRTIERLSSERFRVVVGGLLVLMAAQMLILG